MWRKQGQTLLFPKRYFDFAVLWLKIIQEKVLFGFFVDTLSHL